MVCTAFSSEREYFLIRPISCRKPCQKSGFREDKKCIDVHVSCHEDSAFYKHFLFYIPFFKSIRFKIPMFVCHLLFGFFDDAGHRLHCFYRVFTSCSLSRKHKTVGFLHDTVENIGNFSSRRKRTFHHGFKKLCSNDYEFTVTKTFGHHLSLVYWKHLYRSLYSKISSSNHHSIRNRYYIIQVLYSFLILYLRYYLDLVTLIGIK